MPVFMIIDTALEDFFSRKVAQCGDVEPVRAGVGLDIVCGALRLSGHERGLLIRRYWYVKSSPAVAASPRSPAPASWRVTATREDGGWRRERNWDRTFSAHPRVARGIPEASFPKGRVG